MQSEYMKRNLGKNEKPTMKDVQTTIANRCANFSHNLEQNNKYSVQINDGNTHKHHIAYLPVRIFCSFKKHSFLYLYGFRNKNKNKYNQIYMVLVINAQEITMAIGFFILDIHIIHDSTSLIRFHIYISKSEYINCNIDVS